MTKILLVEDDKSLREIYGVRLFAEGYDVVSAGDGEEALALAIKERPMLIITDVMMPKISGFDMLDILRSTTETKDIKVIVMTALGSEDNKDRGERLGADRYLVKSQVGIEDVVHVVHELLGDQPAGPQPAPTPPPVAGAAPTVPAASQFQAPPAAPTMPQARPATMAVPPRPPEPTQAPAGPRQGMVSAPAVAQPGMPANQQVPMPQPMQPQAQPAASTDEPPSRRTRVIQPINDPAKKVDIQALVDKELAKEGGNPAASADEERQVVADQINTFVGQPAPGPSQLPPVNPPTPQAPPVPPSPAAPQAPAATAPPAQPPAPPAA